MNIHQTFWDLTADIVDELGLPDEMIEAVVETTELKSKEELIKECDESIRKGADNFAEQSHFLNQKDRERFNIILKKYQEKSLDSKDVSTFGFYLLKQTEESEGKRKEGLKTTFSLFDCLIKRYNIRDTPAYTVGGDTIIYSEDGKLEKHFSSEIGHIIAEIGKEDNINRSVSEIFDFAAREAAGIPYSQETIEVNANLGRTYMEAISNDEKRKILRDTHPLIIEDYEEGIKKYGYPAHQEAAYVFKKLKEEYGNKTLKILGKALSNPDVDLNSPLNFYNTIRNIHKTDC